MKLSAAACRRLTLRPIRGVWFRAILPIHLATALETSHTVRAQGRFNAGPNAMHPFEILYLAENQAVALYEVGALLGEPDQPVANPHKTKHIPIDVDVCLQSVADLTDPSQRSSLDLSTQELTGDWSTYDAVESPTQRLGAALFGTKRVEGFVAISAKMPRCRTLVVFPQKLLPGSTLVFKDAITGRLHEIRPARAT